MIFENCQDEGVGLVTETSTPHFSTHKTVFIMMGALSRARVKACESPLALLAGL